MTNDIMLLINCPTTGKAVPTGVWIQPGTFVSTVVPPQDLVNCPRCGGTHRWSKLQVINVYP